MISTLGISISNAFTGYKCLLFLLPTEKVWFRGVSLRTNLNDPTLSELIQVLHNFINNPLVVEYPSGTARTTGLILVKSFRILCNTQVSL